MVKRLLLEELGTYLISETEVKDFKLTKEQVTTYTSGITRTKIIEEKWDGRSYWLRVEIAADPTEVKQSIKAFIEQHELQEESMIVKQKTDNTLKDLEKLKGKVKLVKSKSEKSKIEKEYKKKVDTLNYGEIWIRGVIALYKENYDEAISYAQKTIAENDGFLLCGAYLLLGEAYHKKGTYEKAVATLIEIPKLCPTSKFLPSAHYYLGKTYMDMKDEEKAIAEHKKALLLLYSEKEISVNKSPTTSTKIDNKWMQHIEQNIADNHIALSGAYFFRRARLLGASSTDEVQIPEESWAEIEKVLTLKPNSLKHLKQIEEFVRGVQRYRRDILEWCEKLIKLQSDNGELYHLRGMYYFLLGKNYEQVIKDFSKAIDYSPQDPEKYVSRGSVFVATRKDLSPIIVPL